MCNLKHFRMFANFQYRGLNNFELYCTLTIDGGLILGMHLYSRYLKCMHNFRLVYMVLNVRDGIESIYPSNFFLSIYLLGYFGCSYSRVKE